MKNSNSQTQHNFRPPAAAQYCGVSVSHLAKLRMAINRGKGPTYSKVAGCIVYRKEDLDNWLTDNLVDQAA